MNYLLAGRPTISMIKRQADQLGLDDVVPNFIPRKSAMLFLGFSLWIAACLFATLSPMAFILALPAEAWPVIGSLCGVLGALITTLLVKRYDDRISKRTQETAASIEQLKSTIDWAVKERQELYLESEKAFKLVVFLKDQTIADRDREIALLHAEMQRLRGLLSSPNPPTYEAK